MSFQVMATGVLNKFSSDCQIDGNCQFDNKIIFVFQTSNNDCFKKYVMFQTFNTHFCGYCSL